MSIERYIFYCFPTMFITRIHIAILAAMSVFTGIIAPITSIQGTYIPLPMTNIRIISFIMLFLMVVAFLSAAKQLWKLYNMLALATTFLIGLVLFAFLSGKVEIITSPYGLASSWSWGWVFLLAGVLFFLLQYRTNEKSTEEQSSYHYGFDNIIAYTGSFTLLCLMAVIIFASYFQTTRGSGKDYLLHELYGTGLKVQSWMLVSPSYETIDSLTYTRESGLAFGYKSHEGYRIFSDKKSFSGLVFEKIATITPNYNSIIVHGWKKWFSGIYTGSTAFMTGNDSMRMVNGEKWDFAVMTKSGTKWTIKSTKAEETSFLEGENIEYNSLFNNKLYTLVKTKSWRALYEETQLLWSGSEKIEKVFISDKNTFVLFGKNATGEYIAIQNDTKKTQWTLTGIVAGSFESNGKDISYAIKNMSSYMLVMNEKSFSWEFEEIREVFMNKDGETYFFGKRQGETTWCFYNSKTSLLCNIRGYMNPKLIPEKGSVVFAGVEWQSKYWNIYLNGTIISETNYAYLGDISKDWFFIDENNLRNYLFFHFDAGKNHYEVMKGKNLLPIPFEDVGIEVYFTPKNHVLFPAKKKEWTWHIIEA